MIVQMLRRFSLIPSVQTVMTVVKFSLFVVVFIFINRIIHTFILIGGSRGSMRLLRFLAIGST